MSRMSKPSIVCVILGLTGLLLFVSGCVSQCPPGCSCQDKGDPVEYQVICTNVSQFPALPSRTNTLRITKSTFSQIVKQSLVNLTELHTMEIQQCDNLTSIEGALFENMTKFSSLYLDDIPGLTALPNDMFKGATALESLMLENTNISNIDGIMFQDTPNLKTLKLTNKIVDNINDLTFDFIPGLEELVLTESKLATIPANLFQNLSKLETLYISDNMISTLDRDVFKGLENVVHLRLEGNQLTDIGKDTFSSLKSLVEIDLSQNLFTKLPIEGLENVSSLVSLTMNQNPITTLGNLSFQGMNNLTFIYLNKMSTLTQIEARAFEGLSRLEALSMIENKGLTTIPGEAFGADIAPLLVDLYLSSNGLTEINETIFTNKANLRRATIEGNPFVCDCKIFGLRMMMDDTAQYPYVSGWKMGPLAPLCKSPKRFEQRTIYSLSTSWDLVCGKPAIKYRAPLTMSALEGNSISLQAQVVSTWFLNTSWVNPAGETLTAPYGSAAAKDILSVTETVLENGTVVCNLTIQKITTASTGTYRLTAENQEGSVVLEFTVGVTSAELGSIEKMTIVLCVAIGLVLGTLLVGIFLQAEGRRRREASRQEEERTSLLSDSGTTYGR